MPVVAAVGGVIVPALVFVATVTMLGAEGDALRGWAIPTATDIAFALAVLAVIGSTLPSAMRSFLLTLAVVDDLIAITIIAIFYTSDLEVVPLLLALVPLGLFAALTQRRITYWWLLLPLAFATWGLVHASGVHATVAGVLLGLVVPVKPRASVPSISTHDRTTDVAHRFEHRMRPISAGIAVPVFAFFASGVRSSTAASRSALTDAVALGVIAGLVIGKVVGVFGSTYLVARFTRARLDDELAWRDVVGLAMLTGVGFTVSLLVGELAFGVGSERDDSVKLAVLVGSLLSALLASVAAAHPQPGLPADRRAGVARRRRRRHPRRLRARRHAGPDRGPCWVRSAWRARDVGPTWTVRRTRMATGTSGTERTIGQLVADATHDLEGIVRGEIALAKAEVTDGAKVLGKGAGLLAGAAFLAADGVRLPAAQRGVGHRRVAARSGPATSSSPSSC